MDQHAIVIVDTSGAIHHWSVGAEMMFGHRTATALGQSLDLIVPPEFRDAHWTGFRRAMETGMAEIDGGMTELPVRRADGEVTVFSAAVTLLRNTQGRVIGAMVICTPTLATA